MTHSGIEHANFGLITQYLNELRHRMAPIFITVPLPYFKRGNKFTKMCHRVELSEWCLVLGLRWRSSNEYSRNTVLYTALYRNLEDWFGKS
jgi:hypothetical protein